ncbi:MAG: hypothetical protein AAB438_03530 [Patescibacteria group bacterium]
MKNKKNLFFAFAFLFATNLFSQSWTLSTLMLPDSMNIDQSVMKPYVDILFKDAWTLMKNINSAPTVGEKTYGIDGDDTMWVKHVRTDAGIVFECGANVSHRDPVWFTITTNNIHLQVVPGNGYAKLWTSWCLLNSDLPHWIFYTVGMSELNPEGDWKSADEGRGNFTEADLVRVKKAIETVGLCVPPYQEKIILLAKIDSLAWEAIGRADAIEDDQDFTLYSKVDGWYITYNSVPKGENQYTYMFGRGDVPGEETFAEAYYYDSHRKLVYCFVAETKPQMTTLWDDGSTSQPGCPFPNPPVNLDTIEWQKRE